MTTTTDLKPGDVVRQPVHGYGIVYVDGTGETLVMHCSAKGRISIADLDGWERVETCTTEAVRILEDYQQIVSKSAGVVVRDAVVMMTTAAYEAYRGREIVKPGHVQVRVDDLDLGTTAGRVSAIDRLYEAFTPPQPDEEIVGGGCECRVTPEHTWTTHYGAVEPGSLVEYNPRSPKRDEKPTSATVTLFCPVEGCGEPVEVGVHLWDLKNIRDCYVATECRGHRCKPPQPDEPTEFGARVTVTLPDGTREKRLRVVNGDDWPWRNGDGDRHFWAYLIERGTVTLGWDDES